MLISVETRMLERQKNLKKVSSDHRQLKSQANVNKKYN
jgi:hypothetical protein